jgi:alkanesulfonate monooxygenase SsuD/methylene tetrahydromethanopterin reductase-like flavin-dependent oxidoreductase (luciferase family)
VSDQVRVGLTLPSFVDDPDIPIAVARAAEEAGLDAVFVFDHLWRGDPPKRRPALECFALLGAVAAETTRIQVGTLVARATLRPAATLANCLRTVQRVSGGRLIAAIGAGDSQSRAENEAFGLPFGAMVDRVGALHDAVRAASGNDFPVWVAGHASPVREIVALADGWNGWGHTPEHFSHDVALVREVAPDATLTWGGLILTGSDEATAQAKAERRSLPEDVLVGGPARLAEQLGAYTERGAEWVIAGPIDSSDPDNAASLGEVRALLQA